MRGNKVYVTTKARIFGTEEFIDVFGTYNEAKDSLREKFPYMRKGRTEDVWWADCNKEMLLFIHEKEV